MDRSFSSLLISGTYTILFPNVELIVAYTFDDYVGWAAHQTVSSEAGNSDSETLAALQTVETSVVRIQRHHHLDAGKVSMFSVSWTWQEFGRDLDPNLNYNWSFGSCWSEFPPVVTIM